jgi:hypothetical protein
VRIDWLIDWLLKVQQVIFQSGWEKLVNKKSERGDSGMGQHGQRLNTGTCFSVSSDDKLVLFLFPGIPTGDPAIVAFYDKRIYNKGNAKHGMSPRLKIRPCDLDLWPWKSIGFQILLRSKYVPSLVKIHWRMLILVFTRMLRSKNLTRWHWPLTYDFENQ